MSLRESIAAITVHIDEAQRALNAGHPISAEAELDKIREVLRTEEPKPESETPTKDEKPE